MTATIIFSVRVDINGPSLGEIKEKFDDMPILSADAIDANAEICGVDGVFCDEEDITEDWNKI